MKKLYILLITLFAFTMSHAQIVNIPDANFKNALLNYNPPIDINSDGEIQVSEAEAVLLLNVNGRLISSLEGIQSFTNLVNFSCSENIISSLDVSHSANLELLSCFNNIISNLDVSQNLNLKELWIPNNQITSLDVSQNLDLEKLWCFNNQITSLDVSQNSNLLELLCWSSQINRLNIKNGNNHNMTFVRANNSPNLTCIQVDDETAFFPSCTTSSGWCIDPWAVYSENCQLGVEALEQNSITLYPNPVQDILKIESKQQIETVKIYNLQGQLIKVDLSNSIDVSHLTSGLYFVQVTADGMTETKKFIKE